MKQKLDVVKVKIQLIHEEVQNWLENYGCDCDNDPNYKTFSLFKTLNYIFERETGHIFCGSGGNRTYNGLTSEANYHTIGNLMPEMMLELDLSGNHALETQKIEIKDKTFELSWKMNNKYHRCVELENYQITVSYDDVIQHTHCFIPVIQELEYDTVEIDVKEEGE